MRKRRFGKVLTIAAIGTVGVAVVGEAVTLLWNALLPDLFGLQRIGFWQALGLLLLSRLFFGGFRGRPRPGTHWKRRMFQRWEQMTPEERARFREGMRSRFAGFREPSSEPHLP